MIRRDLASCADIDISPLRLGLKDVLAITVAEPHPHDTNLCYRPGDGELSPHNNSADRGTRKGAGNLPRGVVAPLGYFVSCAGAPSPSVPRQFISAGWFRLLTSRAPCC